MAEETVRNVWDVIGLPNNADRAPIQEREQSLCSNGAQEGDLDKAQSGNTQGTSLNQKGTAEQSAVSIADLSSSSNLPDEPVQNGGDRIEEIIERCTHRQSLMKVLTNGAKDLPAGKAELVNGEVSPTSVEHPAIMTNGSAESNVDLLRNKLSNVEEHGGVEAVSGDNNDRSEPSEVRQERSIFEHINNNFRPPVGLSQSHLNANVANRTGCLGTSVEANVVSNPSRLAVAEEKLEAPGNATNKNNVFERVRIDAFIDSLSQRTSTIEGNGVFPFSDKLRQLTNVNKESGNNMSTTTVQPLRTGYDVASFQRLAPLNANSNTHTISARIVNGRLQPVGEPVIIPTDPPKVDSNLIFPSVTPLNYGSPVSSSVGVKNSYASQDVVSGYNKNRNPRTIQPTAVEKLNFISLDSTRNTGQSINGEKAHSNLNATHLVGPFIGTGPPPPNTYVAAVRPTHVQPLTCGLQPPAYPQLQAVPSPLKGHSSASSFQLVLPVLSNQIIMPSPISMTALERNKLSIRKQHDLICSERLISSPELQERVFRPVSPAKSVINTSTSPRFTRAHIPFQAPSEFHSSPLRAQRSIWTEKNGVDRRGSVEVELADDAYECALRESAHSPDIERYLRCESPVTIQNSPSKKLNSYARENNNSTESLVSPPMACNGDSESTEIPTAHSSPPIACRDDSKNIEIPTTPGSPHVACSDDSENIDFPTTTAEECNEDTSPAKTPEIRNLENDAEDSDSVSKKKQNSAAMIRRLEPRLPSPVRERSEGDLYRDPSELTREERALQRAMMQFSEMEMKAKSKEIKKKDSFKRRLRKRTKEKPPTVMNGSKKQSGANVWLKKLKRRRLWFSQRKSITVKPAAEEDNSTVETSEDHETVVVKRKRSNSTNVNDDQPKRKRKRLEADKRVFVTKPKDASQTTAVLPSHKETDKKPAKVRRSSSDTRGLKETKKENVPESTSCKRSVTADDMGKKVVKRARVEIEPLRVNRQEVTLPNKTDGGKTDKSHRVKTYMLVTAYQGFRDFKPVVLESRTRRKSKQADDEEPQQSTPKAPEFPLLVVESVHSKPVKNSIIAENEEVQQIVENCLKARGKWQVDTVEEETNEDDNLKEARKLNVNRNTGETILHKAARLGYHETVHHHIHQGVDPNAKDNAGWTPLHEACSRGKVDVVKVLAKYGADVNACSNDGIRPIHDAAEGGHVDVLRVLLTYGADPLLATYSGNTAHGCTKDPNTRSFLEGFLEDVDLRSSTLSGSETEGCWEFGGSCPVLDASPDQTSGIFEGVPKDESIVDGEFEMCDRPHLPTYNLPVMQNDELTSGRRNYVLLSDILEHLKIGRGALFKKARKLDIREMPWSQSWLKSPINPFASYPSILRRIAAHRRAWRNLSR
ncbi:uncharacterized protein LOC144663538 isoform X2 [Oculina patagonica]